MLDFAKFVFENLNDYAGGTGFAPLPDEEVEESLRILEELKN